MNEIIIAVFALGIGARYAERIREIAPITNPSSGSQKPADKEV